MVRKCNIFKITCSCSLLFPMIARSESSCSVAEGETDLNFGQVVCEAHF